MKSVSRRWILTLALAAAIPAVQAEEREPPTAGVFVLDDCDSVYEGQETYADNLTFFSPAGKPNFRRTGFNNCQSVGSMHRIAVDSPRRSVWVAENTGSRLQRFDFRGRETLSVPDVRASALSVDPATGNVWVLESVGRIGQGHLAVFDERGQRVAKYQVPGLDIAYDPIHNAFWVVDKTLTKVDAATGKVLFSEKVAVWAAVSLDVDPRDGSVWVAVRRHQDVGESSNQLAHYDARGTRLLLIDLADRMPFRVSIDDVYGGVWVANLRRSFEKYSDEGALEVSVPGEALAVQVDPAGGKVWAFTSQETLVLSAAGEVEGRHPHAGMSSQIWAAATRDR